ncbi:MULTISPECIES: hypothetical protein [Streptomyces]|uniref:hypothetical protein n=1 Tax=Streptomyces TaxID=1883 RepID=UPI0004BFA0D0|nr:MULTISPECIES: hypothetical protein [Streptomyces]MDX3274768.1 hypothetical protein [Streptomyces scabiei]MDX3848106.1 hypothetical protein [Streptomyces europaeiscabiei]
MTEQTAAPTRRGFFRRNLSVLVTAAVLTVVATAAGATWSSQHAARAEQEAQINDVEGHLAGIRKQNAEQVNADVMAALGVSQNRMSTDGERIKSLLSMAFTWDSGQSYDAARESLKSRFSLAENETFLKSFMPPSRFNEDSQGRRYYYIDTVGLNSALGADPDIEVVDVKAGVYTYAILADVEVTSDAVTQNKSSKASVTAHRRALLFVTVDAQGKVSNLSGVPASGETRHSG